MKYSLLFISLLFVGCGSGVAALEPGPEPSIVATPPANYVEPPSAQHSVEVEAYIKEFEALYNRSTNRTTILLVEHDPIFDSGVIAGACNAYGKAEIILNKVLWETFSVERRRNLLFHELGHCLFRRPHKDDYYLDGCPKSHMSTYLIVDGCRATHPEIDAELFDERNSP